MTAGNGVRAANSQRVRAALLSAAAAAFIDQGVQAPVRAIAEGAGVGVATLYRHFPTRADLVAAVYRHQIQECTALAATLIAQDLAPAEALFQWTAAYGDFLITKHGLSAALGSDDPSLANLHALLLDDLVPAFGSLLTSAQHAGSMDKNLTAYALLRAIGNLCIPGPGYDQDEAKRMVTRLLVGCMK